MDKCSVQVECCLCRASVYCVSLNAGKVWNLHDFMGAGLKQCQGHLMDCVLQ